MKRDIIFLFPNTKNQKWNEERFYISKLKKKFKVHIFYFNPRNNKNYNRFSKKNFFKFISKFNNPIFMNHLDKNDKDYKINKTLKKNKVLQTFQYTYRPSFKNESIINFINSDYIEFLLKLFFKKIFHYSFSNKKNIYHYDYFITNDKTISKKQLIKSHERDYYKFVKYKKKANIKKNQVVFIDDAPYNHPDFIALNSLPQLINVKQYKIRLNKILNFFENYFDTQIIIAGHPRLKNSLKYKNIFSGNLIKFNQTEDLIASSKYVLTQGSTAINFAILYKKPVLFLNSKLFYHHYQNHINSMAKLIGSNLFYLEDECFKKNLYPKLNLLKYKKFIKTHLMCTTLKSNEPWYDFEKKFMNNV